jgi:hypothetical protein
MSLSAAVIDAMIAAGCTAEQLGAAVKADLADAEARKEAKRENNAERQRRFRARRKGRKVTARNADNALHDVTPPIDTLTPRSVSSPSGEPQNGAVDVFPRPEWADPVAWADFMGNRKAKKARNTATAYRGFLADIERLSDDEWPPGRLLEHAAAKGWKGIYDPREPRKTANERSAPRNDQITNPYVREVARRQAERTAAEFG